MNHKLLVATLRARFPTKAGWTVLLGLGLALVFPSTSSAESQNRYRKASLSLGDGWTFSLLTNGSARLQYGATGGDGATVPEGTFDYDQWHADVMAAIEAVPQSSAKQFKSKEYFSALRDAELLVSLWEPGSMYATGFVAKFTPEIKGYVDKVLERGSTDRVKALAARYPVLSDKQRKASKGFSFIPVLAFVLCVVAGMFWFGRRTASAPAIS